MNTSSSILSLIIILVNIADLRSAPFGEFYFPDKFERMTQYNPTQLNRQLVFDRDYHIDDRRRYDNQQSDITNDKSDEIHQNDFDKQNDSFDDDNGHFDTNGGNVDNNFDGQNGDNDNRDFPAISNTVCETRCNTNVTPQYNPICGTDGLTYYNSGRMNCAQICGKSVKFVRMGSCSSALISN